MQQLSKWYDRGTGYYSKNNMPHQGIWRKIMVTIHIKDDFIKLGQALKLAGLVDSGVDAKFVIQDGLVKVNGNVEVQRGKKLVSGDVVSYNGKEFVIG